MNIQHAMPRVVFAALFGLALLACQAGGGAASNGAAAKAVESYLQARAQSGGRRTWREHAAQRVGQNPDTLRRDEPGRAPRSGDQTIGGFGTLRMSEGSGSGGSLTSAMIALETATTGTGGSIATASTGARSIQQTHG